MGNYFSSFSNPVETIKYEKFNRFKNEPLYLNNKKYNIFIPSLPSIKE